MPSRRSTAKIFGAIKWFAHLAEERTKTWLDTDPQKLRSDPVYGLKCFLLYANQRSGSPRGYAVAGIKAVEACRETNRPLSKLSAVFKDLYHGKKNTRVMPVLDPAVAKVDVPTIVRLVENGNISAAYDGIDVRGAGHKIKSLFLRDIALTTNTDTRDWSVEQHVFCQPVDVWVRTAADVFSDIYDGSLPAPPRERIRGLSRRNKARATLLISLCLDADVSPLLVNHGIWYFARHAVEDRGRLEELLRLRDVRALEKEIGLIGDFADLF